MTGLDGEEDRDEPEDSRSGGAEISAIGGHEMFPGIGTAFGTSAGEREILQMKSTEIFFELSGARAGGRELLFCAALESQIEAIARQIP